MFHKDTHRLMILSSSSRTRRCCCARTADGCFGPHDFDRGTRRSRDKARRGPYDDDDCGSLRAFQARRA